MARIRTLKPDAIQHRKVGKLSDRAFRLWVGMLTQADDEGRLVADPEQLRVLVFGYQQKVTTEQVAGSLGEVVQTGLIRTYSKNGTQYACFPSWSDHQRIKRPTPSKLPSVEESSPTPLPHLPHTSPTHGEQLTPSHPPEGKGREGKGKEPPKGGYRGEAPEGFQALWSLHPGEKGPKAEALKAYRATKPPPEAADALRTQIAHKADCDRRGVFCSNLPHLHRWLKKRRWEDEIPAFPPGPNDDLPEARSCKACGEVHLWKAGQRLEPCPREEA